ncbi:MAG TPA: hypothetical protein VFS08_11230 [Gemmatimonadaceae bacterium]|nr:hypothetical protein [Gemmatimonadaceae bacterium]
MSRRAIVGGIILLLWVAGLALLVRREYFRPDAERLAMAGLLVSPGATYFRVERDGRHVGFASSTIDTTTRELRIDDRLAAEGAGGGRIDVQVGTRLTRALAPRSFSFAVEGTPLPLELSARVLGDSALSVRVSSGGEAAQPQHVPTSGRAYPPTAVPLLVALGEQRRVGGRLAVTLFDPSVMAARPVVLRVTAESLFTVSDSAALDSVTGRWVSAHQDTVRAWHVEPEGDATPLAGWVDAQGRLVEARYPGGYRLRRTSYEEAAENWRRGRAGAGDGRAND